MNKTTIILGIIALILMANVSAYGGGGSGIILPLPNKEDALMFRHNITTVDSYTFECNQVTMSYRMKNNLFVNYNCPTNYGLKYLHLDYNNTVNDTIEIYSFQVSKRTYKHEPIIAAYMIKANTKNRILEFNHNNNNKIYTGNSLKTLYRTHNNKLQKFVIITGEQTK